MSAPNQSCRSCRFWTPLVEDRYRFDFPSWDGQEYDERDWGTCGRESEPGSPMFTNDASQYFSALRTLASHGCNAWQEPET